MRTSWFKSAGTLTGCILLLVAIPSSLADKICFDLRGTSAGPSRGGISCGGDNEVTDIPAGTTACAALATWKANWDATPGNGSGPVTSRPDGTCDWCVDQVRGAKPNQNTGGGIGYTCPGFDDLSVRRVLNPSAPPPPPAVVKITLVVQVAAGGVIQITIILNVNGVEQQIVIQISTFPGMSPSQLNQQIQQQLLSRGFHLQMDTMEVPELGLRPAFAIMGHNSGGTLMGAEVRFTDHALTQWGVAYEPDAPPPCPGDLDGNGMVDINDLTRLLANFGLPFGAVPENGDIDGDGDVDLDDLSRLLSNFGAACE